MRKITELRRRRPVGPIGCPSDTKDPDDWNWDNWDNWPEGDKEMFPIEEERARLGESVSFIDRWHDTHELLPDCDNVWFIADGRICVGMYEPEQQIFCMADGMGVELKDVRQWKYMSEKQIASFPKEGEILAAEIPDLPCLVTGIFSDHLVDEGSLDEFSGIVIDEIYQFSEDVLGGGDSVRWENVFSWYPLPEEPLKILEPDKYPVAIDTPFKADDAVEDVIEDGAVPTELETTEEVIDDIGPNPEPMPEIGPEPMPEMEADASDESVEPFVEPDAQLDESPVVEEVVNQEESPVSSAIASENPEEEEESLVKKESVEDKDHIRESEEGSLGDKVKPWYMGEYPVDDMGEDINDNLTFGDINDCLEKGDDIYKYIPGDSIIRERIFDKLSNILGVDYDEIYDKWIKSADDDLSDVDWEEFLSKFNSNKEEDVVPEDMRDRAHEIADNSKGIMNYLLDTYGEKKVRESLKKHLQERGLTKSERHNKHMEQIWDTKKRIDDAMARVLKANGVSNEEIEELRKSDSLGKKVNELGVINKVFKESLNSMDRNDIRKLNEDYGWEVSYDNIWNLYEDMKEAFGAEELLESIVKAIGTYELGDALTFICRMNDYNSPYLEGNEDEEEEEEDDLDESKKGKKPLKELLGSDHKIIPYKGYYIEKDFYGDGDDGYPYTVQYCGDDCMFKTVEAAKEFIDDILDSGDSLEEKKSILSNIKKFKESNVCPECGKDPCECEASEEEAPMNESLENLSNVAYEQWTKLRSKLGADYMAEFLIDQMPKHEAELILGYLADVNNIEVNGELY